MERRIALIYKDLLNRYLAGPKLQNTNMSVDLGWLRRAAQEIAIAITEEDLDEMLASQIEVKR